MDGNEIRHESALIGSTGFVGSLLQRQVSFANYYRSTTIGNIEGKRFNIVVCSAAPAQKWIANRDPITDKANINALIFHLENVGCNKFILISTVDVFMNPVGIDEESVVDEVSLHPYGQHRRDLEKFVENHFPNHLIVRLPGLVGPGLRKNVIFDFLNNNNLHTIDSRGIFQFYPMVNLWSDINTALQSELKLVHLTAEPISVSDIAEFGFGKHFVNKLANPPASYDFCTKHAALFGGKGLYQYSKRETVLAIRAYAQSEPLTIKSDLGTGAL